MSSAEEPCYFRRRNVGRAASPPTWACYEQIPCDDDYSDSGSDSCSEDDEEYPEEDKDLNAMNRRDGRGDDSDSGTSDDMNMDMVEEGDGNKARSPQEVKGKQKAVDTEPEKIAGPRRRKLRSPTYTLRPILTIHRSQGFVWNQDLFVPPYIKDRYIASTSPPNAPGFLSSSASSTNSGFGDYEIEVVEIRVTERDLDCIMP